MKSPFLPPFLSAIALTLFNPLASLTPVQAVSPIWAFSATHPMPLQSSPSLKFAQLEGDPPDVGTPRRVGGGGTYYRSPKPPTVGTPGGRPRGGASRGICPKVETPLTMLIPFDEVETQSPTGEKAFTNVWGLTTAERPIFWFFVPYTQDKNLPAEFVLQDAGGKDIYRTPVSLPKQAGILPVRLSETVAPLEVGKPYQVYFKVGCTAQTSEQPKSRTSRNAPPISVKGWVQRTPLDATLTKQLADAKPQARPSLYAKNGIWFDALTAIAELRLQKPTDPALLSEWKNLLNSVKLDDVSTQPFVK